MTKPTVFPLSAITKRINELLKPAISTQFWVKAEISSGIERGGAFYCDLIETDANGKTTAKLRCNIWSQDLRRIREHFQSNNIDLVLDNGTAIVLLCSLQFHPQYGISLKAIDADPSFALGEMELKKREIIERLEKEGLFENNKKHLVPILPLRVGLVTSHGSAAYNDFIQTISNSGYGFRVLVADAMMQGEQTERGVLKALESLIRLKVELIVIVRGGGSKTDLFALDNEVIARKIAGCPIPVWTGIGHEIDVSVLDYVANRRFKTPTAVAEDLVARFTQMQRKLDEATSELSTVWEYRFKIGQDHLERAKTGVKQGSRKLLDLTSSTLRERAQRLRYTVSRRVSGEQLKSKTKSERLRSLPVTQLQNCQERLTLKLHNLSSRAKKILTTESKNFVLFKQRFVLDRFRKRTQVERSNLLKTRRHLQDRFIGVIRLWKANQKGSRGRFKVEKLRQRIQNEARSLTERGAVLRASDPQRVLERGFTLAYHTDGQLLKSIQDVNQGDKVRTQFFDGSVISEVILKQETKS